MKIFQEISRYQLAPHSISCRAAFIDPPHEPVEEPGVDDFRHGMPCEGRLGHVIP